MRDFRVSILTLLSCWLVSCAAPTSVLTVVDGQYLTAEDGRVEVSLAVECVGRAECARDCAKAIWDWREEGVPKVAEGVGCIEALAAGASGVLQLESAKPASGYFVILLAPEVEVRTSKMKPADRDEWSSCGGDCEGRKRASYTLSNQ